jgi:hypothetical protein
MTNGQSASVSWNIAPIWGLRPDFYYCQTVVGSLIWGALSDERTGLSFTIAAGPRQRSHSHVLILWDSGPYFTLSDSRLPFSSPPTTRRAMVEVFDPASTWDTHSSESVSDSCVMTNGQLASLSWSKTPTWGLWPDFYYCQTFAGFLLWGTHSDERMGLSFKDAAGPRQRSHFRARVLWYSWSYFTVSDSTHSSESESYIMTDGQSASLSWNKAFIWGLRPYFYYCQTVAGFLMWGALWQEDGSVV